MENRPKQLKLIIDHTNSDIKDYKISYITESINGQDTKSMYLEGPYTEADARNKNGRIYPYEILANEIAVFKREYVDKKRATGELEHPDYPELNAKKACHLILDIWQDNSNPRLFIGKSKVLSTPDGKILENLLRDGVQLGVSSRSLGVEDESTGYISDLKLCTFDVVADPSCPKAYVNGILESKTWICNYDSNNERVYEIYENGLSKLPVKDKDKNEKLRYLMKEFIRNIR